MALLIFAAGAVLGQLVATALCPAKCRAADNSEWPCRYYDDNCTVNPLASSHRGDNPIDINVAAINPYSGGLGDLMTMVEPSIAQAIQDIEDSNLLPGYRLKVHLVDSKCSVPDATFAAQATCSTGPTKHVLLSDSCSAACAAVNDAARFFKVLQVGPGCVSARLRDSERYPFFTRMAPSTYYNVIAIFELMKFLSFKRIGVVHGYRDINHAARDLFLDLVEKDLHNGVYSWVLLITLSVKTLDDAKLAAKEIRHHDSRINFMALYELEGAMVLCQAFKDGMQPPDYNFFVASGWWNAQFLQLTANSASCPCTSQELYRASYGLIAADRGPMLRSTQVHSLSGRRLQDIYDEYTVKCEAFGNGIGACNHQWAGYFYDGMWLIAKVLDTYFIQQNKSLSDLGTEESRQALYDLSLGVDFYGQTGRVRQWQSQTQLDRDGIILLRQVTGTVDNAFTELAYRTSEGFQFQANILWTSDGQKKVTCNGASCEMSTSWIPLDGVDQCAPGEVWSKILGCSQCNAGTFSSDGHGACQSCPSGSYGNESGMTQCYRCEPGSSNPLTGMTACIPCLTGHFMKETGALRCEQCPKGQYAAKNGKSTCDACPPGRTTSFEGATEEELCQCDGHLFQGTCVQCETGTRFEAGQCVNCVGLEICEHGEIVGNRTSDDEWHETIDLASAQCALSQEMARRFFLVASGIEVEVNKGKLRSSMNTFDTNHWSLMLGNSSQQVVSPPNEDVRDALLKVQHAWRTFQVFLTDKMNSVVDFQAVAQVAEQNLEVLHLSELVGSLLSEAAQKAGATSKGLLGDVAGRQKTLILRFAKEVLVIGLGHSISNTRTALRDVADLFEASQDAMIFGVNSVGLPKLDQMCTMKQMRDVSFYSRQVMPMVREVVNAESNAESVATATRISFNLSALTEPFFDAMLEAQHLLEHPGNCIVQTDPSEWRALLSASAHVRCHCEMAFLYFLQILNGVEVDASKVKLTVQISAEHSELRKLVQGSRLDGIPTPPTQEIMDEMLEALAAWTRLEALLAAAAEMDTLPAGHLARTVRLREDFEHRMDSVLHLIEDAANYSAAEIKGIPLLTLDMLHLQRMRLNRLAAEAHLVLYGHKADLHREMLNGTAKDIHETSKQLILGTEHSATKMALQPIRNLCVIHSMADAMEVYGQVEEAAHAMANGSREEAVQVTYLIPEGLERMTVLTRQFDHFHGGAADANNCSKELTAQQWLQLMSEVVHLACLGEELASHSASTNASAALAASLGRLQMGSTSPPVPPQPTQELYDQVMDVLAPLVQAVQVGDASDLTRTAFAQLERYAAKGQSLDPVWPGQRLKIYLWQKVMAMQVYSDLQMDRSFEDRIQQFDVAHLKLKDGGGGVAPLERTDLLEAWKAIDDAWTNFKDQTAFTKQSRLKARLDDLQMALNENLPVFAIPDDVPIHKVKVPWGYYIVYPVLGVLVLCCCAGACCLGRNAAQKRANTSSSARRNEEKEGSP